LTPACQETEEIKRKCGKRKIARQKKETNNPGYSICEYDSYTHSDVKQKARGRKKSETKVLKRSTELIHKRDKKIDALRGKK